MSYYDYDSRNNYHYNWLGFGISLVLLVALFVGIWYLWLPAWSFNSVGMWFYVILAFAACAIIPTAIGCTGNAEFLPAGITAIIAGVLVVALIVVACGSGKLFHVDTYRAAAEIITGENAADVLPDTDTMPIIDRNTARKLGDRTMGAMEKYLSQYEVSSEYNLIVYNGEDYYVSPLLYGGFFKYNNSKNVGIPAYVLVNARTGEAQLIELESGKEILSHF